MRGRGRNDGRNNSGRQHGGSRRGAPRNSRNGGSSYRDQNRSRGHGRHDPRAAATSGNQRERIAIESGSLVLIDQFMLANPQFVDRLLEIIDDGPEVKDELIRKYGGAVVELPVGTYKIKRDPYAYTIVIHRDNVPNSKEELMELATESQGCTYIDTRCLAMIDRELLDDSLLLEKYQQLWFGGHEKACRDLIRDNGGAVRYGFRRFGDELGVYTIPDDGVVCLWPDLAEGETIEEQQAEEY
ncbi:MAG: hypothetical protein ACOX2O_05655 [Bdellovibrionota bacterium]|jgi:hypothetical protein